MMHSDMLLWLCSECESEYNSTSVSTLRFLAQQKNLPLEGQRADMLGISSQSESPVRCLKEQYQRDYSLQQQHGHISPCLDPHLSLSLYFSPPVFLSHSLSMWYVLLKKADCELFLILSVHRRERQIKEANAYFPLLLLWFELNNKYKSAILLTKSGQQPDFCFD